MVVLLLPILTFIIRELAVFALEEEVPKANIWDLEGRICRIGRHVRCVVEALMYIESQTISMRFNAIFVRDELKRQNRG